MKALRFLRALPLALLLIGPARADQGSIVGPTSGPAKMSEVMADINAALLAIQSCNSGPSAPANGPGPAAKAFQCWADTSASPVITYKTYDGASWVAFGQLNTSTHIWTPYRNGALIAAVATSSSAADLTTGTLPAGRLPVPTGSTLGGVQSKTCSASHWLNEISTSGVLNCAPPNFTDLAGTAALAQLPSFSGMSAAAAAADADTFPTNQGAGNLKQTLSAIKTWIKAWIVKADVGLGNVDNTSDATKWGAAKTFTNTTFNCGSTGNVCTVRLAPDITGFGTGVASALGVNIGSSGAPLLFNGAGGTPSSMVGTNITGTASGLTAGNVTTNANMTGDVTSVGNVTTLTNAPVISKVLTAFAAGAGTVSSSDSILTAFQKVVGNLALKADLASPALTGAPTATTASPSNNSTRIATTAYVDAQVAGGVAGVTSVNGQGGIVKMTTAPQGRLTLQSGAPVMLAPQIGKTTIFYSSYVGDQLPIYDGASMVPTTITGGEISASTTDTTKNPAVIGASKVNDWFVWNDGGTIRLSHGPDWTSDILRSAGTALVKVNGVYLNNASITNGPAASRGTYVGTTKSDIASQLDWIPGYLAAGGGPAFLGVWNAYNRVDVFTMVQDSTDSWPYATASWRAPNGATGMRVQYVTGLGEDSIGVVYNSFAQTSGGGVYGAVGVGIDSTAAYSGSTGIAQISGLTNQPFGSYRGNPGLGFHFASAIELASSATVTFYGDVGIPSALQSALQFSGRF